MKLRYRWIDVDSNKQNGEEMDHHLVWDAE